MNKLNQVLSEEAGLTQKQIAENLVSESYYCQLETTKKNAFAVSIGFIILKKTPNDICRTTLLASYKAKM